MLSLGLKFPEPSNYTGQSQRGGLGGTLEQESLEPENTDP